MKAQLRSINQGSLEKRTLKKNTKKNINVPVNTVMNTSDSKTPATFNYSHTKYDYRGRLLINTDLFCVVPIL